MFFLRSLPLLGLAASATAVLASPLCARGNSYEQHTRKQVEKTFIHPGSVPITLIIQYNIPFDLDRELTIPTTASCTPRPTSIA